MRVSVSFLEAGFCMHPEFTVIEGGARSPIRFGSSVAVIEHPTEGIVLFDTGYSLRFYEQTRRFPDRLYALATPVRVSAEQTAAAQLAQMGVRPDDVRTVILSHFHADHIAGAADFPRARYVFRDTAYERVKKLGTLGRLRAGFLPGLLPADFEARARAVSAAEIKAGKAPVGFQGCDLFGDGSVVLVDLAGHAPGHTGLFVHGAESDPYFLVADACWLSRAYRESKLPHIVTALIMDSRPEYRRTLERIHALHESEPTIRIVPCHCGEAFDALPRWAATRAASLATSPS